MPELPEVESIKLQLSKFLPGHTIEEVEIRYSKCFEGDVENIEEAEIKSVRRFGKVIVIDLDNGYSLVIHIKLTGQLVYRGPNLRKAPQLSRKITGGLRGPHTHVIFRLDDRGSLYYNDVRKFGWIKTVKSDQLKEVNFLRTLGPEFLTDVTKSSQEHLTLEKFKKITGSTKRSIKTLLMDQGKISGVGNIYAIDALWLAKIHPERPADSLSGAETKRLYKSIEKVLKEGLKMGGASELAFVRPDGTEGGYQKNFLAYGRGGKMCPRCKKAKFVYKKIAGRGTVFCPNCQSV